MSTVKEKPVSWEKYPLMTDFSKMLMIPALSAQLTDAMLYGKPYPLKAAMVIGSNPVSTAGPNRKDWEEALSNTDKLEFLAVNDLFMTGTAKYADIFLPAAWWPEVVELSEQWPYVAYALLKDPVKPAGECRPVVDWLLDLAKRMGMEEQFPWNDVCEVIDDFFKPFSVEELKKHPTGMWVPGCKLPDDIRYKKYETMGFNTPSKKIELYSQVLEEDGDDPLPIYRDYAEILSKETELSVADIEAEYPLYLTKHNTYIYMLIPSSAPSSSIGR